MRLQKVDFSRITKVAVFLQQLRGSALLQWRAISIVPGEWPIVPGKCSSGGRLEGETAEPSATGATEWISENPALSTFDNQVSHQPP